MALKRIIISVCRFIRFAETDQIGSDCPMTGINNNGDHLSIKEGPCRFSVEEQNDMGVFGSFVDVVDSQFSTFAVRNFRVVRLERIAGKTLETLVRCPENFHFYTLLPVMFRLLILKALPKSISRIR